MDETDEQEKEEKERRLQLKIEAIRLKNKEIMKRYAEIEADKKNADILSSQTCTNKPVPLKSQQAEGSRNKYSAGRGRRLQEVREHMVLKTGNIAEDTKHRLEIGQGPPPDPNFNFLEDRSRIRDPTVDDLTNRQDGSRRHRINFGGTDFDSVKATMQQQRQFEKEHPLDPPRSKMEMSLRMTGKERTQYQIWKEEREAIDRERLARHRTSTGSFRREWDLEKDVRNNEESRSSFEDFNCSDIRSTSSSRGGRQVNRSSYHGGGRQFARGRSNSNRNFQTREQEQEESSPGRSVALGQKDDLQVNVQNSHTDRTVSAAEGALLVTVSAGSPFRKAFIENQEEIKRPTSQSSVDSSSDSSNYVGHKSLTFESSKVVGGGKREDEVEFWGTSGRMESRASDESWGVVVQKDENVKSCSGFEAPSSVPFGGNVQQDPNLGSRPTRVAANNGDEVHWGAGDAHSSTETSKSDSVPKVIEKEKASEDDDGDDSWEDVSSDEGHAPAKGVNKLNSK